MGQELKANPIGFVGGMEDRTDIAFSTSQSALFSALNQRAVLTGIEANPKKYQAQTG